MQNMENHGSSTEVEHNSGTESSELQTNGAINSSQPNVNPFNQWCYKFQPTKCKSF